MVDRQGCPRAARPPGAAAPHFVRLARYAGKCSTHFLSSAPFGFESMQGQRKRKAPVAGSLVSNGGPSGMSPGGTAARGRCAARARGLRAPLGNGSRRFLSYAPFGFESMHGRQKRKASTQEAFILNGGPSGIRTLDLGIKSPLL